MSFDAIADKIEQRGLTYALCGVGEHRGGRVCIICAFTGFSSEYVRFHNRYGDPYIWARKVKDQAAIVAALRELAK